MDTKERNKKIQESDAHWSELAAEYGLHKSSIYRIQAAGRERPAVSDRRIRASDTTFAAIGRSDLFGQVSVSGLTRHGGAVSEEFQRELQEDGGAKIYTEMSVHPVVAAVMFAIKMSLRRVRWWMGPASDLEQDRRKAEFVDECREDMSQSWAEVVSQIFAMLTYGFQPCELVYKKRLGYKPPKYVPDPARSRYEDGLIGWRRWQFIKPTSLSPGNQWDFDEYGRVQAINQTPPPDYVPRKLPMEKALLFRTDVQWDNPEGLSVLRSMYSPWYYAQNLAEVEAIGAERLGVGLPVVYLGDGTSMEGSNSDHALAQDLVVNVRVDEQMGVVIPHPKLGTADPGRGMLFELVSPPSRGFVDFDAVIERYEKRMAMTVLAQFIFLGMRQVGTQALAETSTDFFVDAVGAWSDAVADVINRFAIPRLLALNPFGVEDLPELQHSEIGVPDLGAIANYINQLVGAEVILPYQELERHLLEVAGMPDKPEAQKVEAPQREQEPEETEAPEVEEPIEEEPGTPEEEGAETFALRKKPGGPKWERATNSYEQELRRTWDDWAAVTARDMAGAETDEEREDLLDEAIAAIILSLMVLGRENLPTALGLGLAGTAASPDGLQVLAQAMADNEGFLRDSLGPAIRAKVLKAIGDDALVATDPLSLGSVLGTFGARVGSYAGTFWQVVQRGVLDRVGQLPNANEVPVRQVLDPRAKHCKDCPLFAKEYANYDAYLVDTGGRVPGQFECNGNCRCHLEFKIPGKGWSRW